MALLTRFLALVDDRGQGEFLEGEVGLEPMSLPDIRLLVVTRKGGPAEFLDREVTLDAMSGLEDTALATETESSDANWGVVSDT